MDISVGKEFFLDSFFLNNKKKLIKYKDLYLI